MTRRGVIGAGLALLAMGCLYNLPQLLLGTVQFDGLDVHYTAQRYLSDELHAGRVPFWTAYVFTGFPFLADLQIGAWYPLNWPFFLAGITPRSIGGELLVHNLIACGGAYALALRLIGRTLPAVAAGMFYGFSGWFAAHAQHVGMFEEAAWLPWLVLLLDSLRQRLTPTRLALAGVLGAAVMLPGHFQIALYTFSFVGVWAALESVLRRSWISARGLALGLLSTGAWGALLSAVMILPAVELVDQSLRTELNALDLPNIGYFHPDSLLTLIDPDYYGLLSGHYSGPGDRTQHYFYAGILLVPLAVLGAGNRRILCTSAFLGLPFLWYALGPVGGLFDVVARLPGFRSVELPMHGWFLPALGLALLGGAGMAALEGRLPPGWSVTIIGLILIDVVGVNQLLNPLAYARGSFDELYGTTLQRLQSELNGVERLYGPPLTAVGYRNHALQSRVETTYGYNPLELTTYANYADAAESNPPLIAGFAANGRVFDGPRIETEPNALPVAYFARSISSVEDEYSARAVLTTLDPSRATIVIGPPPVDQTDPNASVMVVTRGEDTLTLHYRSATPNLLRMAIPAYPGWHAQLNGVELSTLNVDEAFLGVVVPPGESDVHLWYMPRVFWWGATISLTALIVGLVALAGASIIERR